VERSGRRLRDGWAGFEGSVVLCSTVWTELVSRGEGGDEGFSYLPS
jgi:hypothetical protein